MVQSVTQSRYRCVRVGMKASTPWGSVGRAEPLEETRRPIQPIGLSFRVHALSLAHPPLGGWANPHLRAPLRHPAHDILRTCSFLLRPAGFRFRRRKAWGFKSLLVHSLRSRPRRNFRPAPRPSASSWCKSARDVKARRCRTHFGTRGRGSVERFSAWPHPLAHPTSSGLVSWSGVRSSSLS